MPTPGFRGTLRVVDIRPRVLISKSLVKRAERAGFIVRESPPSESKRERLIPSWRLFLQSVRNGGFMSHVMLYIGKLMRVYEMLLSGIFASS